MTRRRKLSFLVFTMLLAGVVAALAAEIYIRQVAPYITPGILRERTLKYEPAVFAASVLAREPHVAQFGEGPNAARVPINRHGYRGPEFDPVKPQGVTRIMIYGGSAVFDAERAGTADWPNRAGQMLREMGFPGAEVINAGIPGHASYDSLGRFITEGHLFRPDYVVLYNQWNDIKQFRFDGPLIRRHRVYVPTSDPRLHYANAVDRLLCNTSQLFVRLRQRYYNRKLRVGAEGATPVGQATDRLAPDALRQYRLDVQLFVDAARNTGAVPVLMTQARLAAAGNTPEQQARIAYKYVLLTPEALLRAFAATDEIIHSVGVEKGVHVIEAAHLSGRDDILKDHIHLTEKGSEELARLTAQGLAEIMRAGIGQATHTVGGSAPGGVP